MINRQKYFLLAVCLLTAMRVHAQEDVDIHHQNTTENQESLQKPSCKDHIKSQKLFNVLFSIPSSLFYISAFINLAFTNKFIEMGERSGTVTPLSTADQKVAQEINTILDIDPSIIKILKMDNHKVSSVPKYILLPEGLFHDLQNGTEERRWAIFANLAHEYIHLKNHHTIKVFASSFVLISSLLYFSHRVYKKYQSRLSSLITSVFGKFEKVGSVVNYTAQGILGFSIPIAAMVLGGGIVQKTLGRYFERCADNINHENSEYHKNLLEGLVNSYETFKNDPLYQQYQNSMENYLFGPHDHVDKRISVIKERIDHLHPELKIVT